MTPKTGSYDMAEFMPPVSVGASAKYEVATLSQGRIPHAKLGRLSVPPNSEGSHSAEATWPLWNLVACHTGTRWLRRKALEDRASVQYSTIVTRCDTDSECERIQSLY